MRGAAAVGGRRGLVNKPQFFRHGTHRSCSWNLRPAMPSPAFWGSERHAPWAHGDLVNKTRKFHFRAGQAAGLTLFKRTASASPPCRATIRNQRAAVGRHVERIVYLRTV